MPLLPYVRREIFLQAIKNRDASALPDPNNREELFLKAIADEVALIPSGVSVVLPAEVSEMLANLPEAHTHTERFYRDIIDAILVSTTVTDTTPYLIRDTANHAPITPPARLTKKLGNTVGVNQVARRFDNALTYWNVSESNRSVSGQEITATPDSGTSVPNINIKADYAVPMIPGHRYLFHFDLFVNDMLGKNPRYNFFNAYSVPNITAGVYNSITGIGTVDSAFNSRLSIYPWSTASATFDGTQYFKVRNLFVIDLTLWFGSNDLIPSDLLSHPENWGRYFAGSLDFAAGYLDSADGTVMKSIGRNLFDKDTMTITDEYISDSNGNAYTQVGSICTDFIEVIPNTDYYIKSDATGGRWGAWYDRDKNFIRGISGEANKTAPANARYIRFTIKYNNSGGGNKDTFCISLYYSGESGYDQYYPYSVLAEVDTGSEVLRSAGAVADEKTPDGTITRNVGYVDLGTLNWSYISAYGCFYVPVAPTPTPKNNFVCICSKYSYGGAYSNLNDKQVGFIYNNTIAIKDSTYGTDAAAFKTAMSGVYLYYELATPTTEQGTAFDPVYGVEYGGTESWTNLKGIPQGHETEYTEYTT